MVQKSTVPRGRPRAYDPETALARAMEAFWDAGYAATSLDDLSRATGMNRPSLYAAFGDKRALYQKALDRYRESGREAIKEALVYDQPLREALSRLYASAISLYLSGAVSARGCFLIGTAVTGAVTDPDVRTALGEALHEIDDAIEARLRFAQSRGELDAKADPASLAKLVSAALYGLGIRARAGETRAALEVNAAAAVDLICGAPKVAAKKRRR